jgi:hypothetical protein
MALVGAIIKMQNMIKNTLVAEPICGFLGTSGSRFEQLQSRFQINDRCKFITDDLQNWLWNLRHNRF